MNNAVSFTRESLDLGNGMVAKEIKKIVSKLESLPALPVVAAKVLEMFVNDDTHLDDVACLVETDQAIAGKLLQTVNSASFGFQEPVGSLSRALLMLGFNEARGALLSVTVSESLLKPLRDKHPHNQDALWKHCLACAVCAEMLAERVCPDLKAEAFVAGLIHDVGKLVLEECISEKYEHVKSLYFDQKKSMLDAEVEILGVDHATVGKWLAEKWRLPDFLIQAVWLHHHSIEAVADLNFVKRRDYIAVVQLADMLSHEIMADLPETHNSIESDYRVILEFLDISDSDIKDISASVGKRYSERALILDIEEDELSFYISALQRANHKLAGLAAKNTELQAVKKSNRQLNLLHDFYSKLLNVEDIDEVLNGVAGTFAVALDKEEGIVYYLDYEGQKMTGALWSPGSMVQTVVFDLDDNKLPVFNEEITGFSEKLKQLIKTCHIRFLSSTTEKRRTNLVQYHDPYLVMPFTVNCCFTGELITTAAASDTTGSNPISKKDLKVYEHLVSITVAALSRIRLLEEGRNTADALSMALSKNARIVSELKQSTQRFENLFELFNDAIVLHHPDEKIVRANQRMVELLGFGDKELANRCLSDLLAVEVSGTHGDILRMLWKSQEGGRLETRFQHRDGRAIDVEISSRIAEPSTGLVQSIIRDISGQKRAAKELAAQKERLTVTLRSIDDGVISTDIEGKVTLINKMAETLIGYSEQESVGGRLDEVFRLVDAKNLKNMDDPVKKVLSSGTTVSMGSHVILIARDGTERYVTASGAPIRDREDGIVGVALVFRDITEKRKMEEDLLRAQKLDSLGVLAGGIAHDFNNILSALMGNISMAKIHSKPGETIYCRLDQAEDACSRAKDLTQQLLTFSRGGAPVKKAAHISEIIKGCTCFVLRGSNVRCEFSLPEDLAAVNVDVGQMSQVVNNLIINADQAMPEGGSINVSAKNITVPHGTELPLTAGNYVKISIKDQGIGIPEKCLDKIFDPYFTTKTAGNGLGLASCYSIINRHNGYLTVESTVGIGTTFHIYLPASTSPLEVEEKDISDDRRISGAGRILIMDDEQTVRDVVGMMLEYMGYEAYYAKDGKEAIEFYKDARTLGSPFDAVIMDLTIPGGMGGKEAIAKLIEIDPDVKAIVSSGYSSDDAMSNYRELGFCGVIAKPYQVEQLGGILSRVLGAAVS